MHCSIVEYHTFKTTEFQDKPHLQKLLHKLQSRENDRRRRERIAKDRGKEVRQSWKDLSKAERINSLIGLCDDHPEWQGHYPQRLSEVTGFSRYHMDTFLPTDYKLKPRGKPVLVASEKGG